MKLTSQQEFGLRCLLRLAREERSDTGTGVVNTLPVNKISEDEGLSTEYAGKLMGVLTRCGLVESVRGRNGGYRLARPAAEISLAESMTALGGKLFDDATCDRFRGDRHHCIHSGACTIRSVWTGLQFVLDQVLTRTSLRDMVEHSEEGMAEWVQRHVSALVDSASDGASLVPTGSEPNGGASERTGSDSSGLVSISAAEANGERSAEDPPAPANGESIGGSQAQETEEDGSRVAFTAPGRHASNS